MLNGQDEILRLYATSDIQLDEEAEGEGAAEEGAGGTGVETPVLTCSLHWWVKGAREFHSPTIHHLPTN